MEYRDGGEFLKRLQVAQCTAGSAVLEVHGFPPRNDPNNDSEMLLLKMKHGINPGFGRDFEKALDDAEAKLDDAEKNALAPASVNSDVRNRPFVFMGVKRASIDGAP